VTIEGTVSTTVDVTIGEGIVDVTVDGNTEVTVTVGDSPGAVGPVDPFDPVVGPVAGPVVGRVVGWVVGALGPAVRSVGPRVDPFGPTVGPFGPTVGPFGPTVGPFGPPVDPPGPAPGCVGSEGADGGPFCTSSEGSEASVAWRGPTRKKAISATTAAVADHPTIAGGLDLRGGSDPTIHRGQPAGGGGNEGSGSQPMSGSKPSASDQFGGGLNLARLLDSMCGGPIVGWFGLRKIVS
jgi:hypothetical protein